MMIAVTRLGGRLVHLLDAGHRPGFDNPDRVMAELGRVLGT
jgi:hypothetical protein